MALLSEGQMIRGTYEVERFLGEGAFAEVYRVKHRFLGRQAMKVFKSVGMTIDKIEELLGEAIMLSQVRHPNIVHVFDANVTETSRGKCGFFTMECVAGGSLEQFWRSHGGQFVPLETTVDIIRQVCRGLAVAHSEDPPIVHRDVKPQNILVGYDRAGLRVRVSDFGLAKRVNPLTLMASAKGTLSFKAPEVFRDCRCDSCSGDVWAIGTSLYLLLTDQLPYEELDGLDVFDGKCFKHEIIPPSRLNLHVDRKLDQIVLRALALDSESRYTNAQELLDVLETWEPRARRTRIDSKSKFVGELSKDALGTHTPPDQTEGERMAADALRLSQQAGKLGEAADLMEEAFNKWPELRARHEAKVKLWRCGIAM